jgi:hypothetical protein
MSFAPFISSQNNLNKFDPKKLAKKERFIDTENKKFYCDTPGYWEYDKKWNVIDAESNLITPGVGTRQKTKMELKNNIHPNNYEVPVENKIEKEEDNIFYFSGYDTGPGRGFGNMSVSSSIRLGDFTRTETRNFKAKKESEVIERWDFIDDRYAIPENLVMELPRGGDTTRRAQYDLSLQTRQDDNREFVFKY